ARLPAAVLRRADPARVRALGEPRGATLVREDGRARWLRVLDRRVQPQPERRAQERARLLGPRNPAQARDVRRLWCSRWRARRRTFARYLGRDASRDAEV